MPGTHGRKARVQERMRSPPAWKCQYGAKVPGWGRRAMAAITVVTENVGPQDSRGGETLSLPEGSKQEDAEP